MSFYKEQTKRMIALLKEDQSLNVMRDFFTQLSRIRPLDAIALINSFEPSDVDSSKLICESVTQRDWMKTISLEDIRNHIVFTVWKEHQIIIESENYYDSSLKDEFYHSCHRQSKPSLHSEEIGVLLETCFYIRQVCILKEIVEDGFDDLSIIEEPDWDMYHFWLLHHVNTNGLKHIVYENFKLLEPLIRYSEK